MTNEQYIQSRIQQATRTAAAQAEYRRYCRSIDPRFEESEMSAAYARAMESDPMEFVS